MEERRACREDGDSRSEDGELSDTNRREGLARRVDTLHAPGGDEARERDDERHDRSRGRAVRSARRHDDRRRDGPLFRHRARLALRAHPQLRHQPLGQERTRRVRQEGALPGLSGEGDKLRRRDHALQGRGRNRGGALLRARSELPRKQLVLQPSGRTRGGDAQQAGPLDGHPLLRLRGLGCPSLQRRSGELGELPRGRRLQPRRRRLRELHDLLQRRLHRARRRTAQRALLRQQV